MKELGYYNGRIGELSEMTVPMNDRASWFGDGVYDAELVRNYVIFALDEHVDRFFRSASMLKIEIPMTKDELKALLNDLVKKMDTGDLFLYYQVTRGDGPRAHVFPEGKANLWVTLVPKKLNPEIQAVKLITAEDTRFFHCNIKTLNLIPSVMASQKAKEAGAYECVLYRPGERVTECAHSNVSILKDGVLFTAPTDNLILPGISRARLIRACKRLGIPVREEPFTLDALRNADEIIVTSSSNICVRGREVDDAPAGMKDEARFTAIHRALVDEYMAETTPA
ncbi:MAG: D-amino acid aminotransferase [Clostridiales bacterium]|nr:D-amino acid aminotransferase [Clostridiales bacterium]